MNTTQKENIEKAVSEINRFDKKCEEDEYTDHQEMWDLLHWLRDTLKKTLEPIHTIKIEISGGVLVNVENLPPDTTYELIDHDDLGEEK